MAHPHEWHLECKGFEIIPEICKFLSLCKGQYGSSLLMLQPCRRNVGPAGFCIGTSEDDGHADDLPTLGKQRWENIVFGKALTTGLWRLLSMVIGCGSQRILCFSRFELVDRVKSCISFVCALKGPPSGRQVLTLTLTLLPEHGWIRRVCLAPTTKENWTNIYDPGLAITTFCSMATFEDWIVTAQATDLWQHYLNEFCTFILG